MSNRSLDIYEGLSVPQQAEDHLAIPNEKVHVARIERLYGTYTLRRHQRQANYHQAFTDERLYVARTYPGADARCHTVFKRYAYQATEETSMKSVVLSLLPPPTLSKLQ